VDGVVSFHGAAACMAQATVTRHLDGLIALKAGNL
jgi:hypothetical protein